MSRELSRSTTALSCQTARRRPGRTLAVALPKAYAELAAKGIEPKRQLPILGP